MGSSSQESTGDFRLGDWLVRTRLNRIERGERLVAIEPRALEVLVHLARHSREVCSKEDIIQAVWGDAFITDEALTNAISKLRQALGDDARRPRYIQTVSKKGYRLLAPVVWEDAPQDDSRFRLEKKLGRGAMGEVYLAYDPLLRRQVALKFLHPEIQHDESMKRRLLREARAGAALDHPFICKVHDSGEAQGRAFIVMEYLQGENLAQRLESQGPLPPDAALAIAIEAAEALAAAHQQGMLHRDLKPANLMLTPQGHVKILDFGLVRRLPAAGDDLESWTSTLSQSGSLAVEYTYRSPEQMMSGRQADVRSDIFSLGLVIFEMLTGRHPFCRQSAVHTAVALLTEPPPAESEFPPDTPQQLRTLVRGMLSRSPEQRPASMSEVLLQLQGVRADSRPRRRFTNLAAIITVAALVAVWLLWIWLT